MEQDGRPETSLGRLTLVDASESGTVLMTLYTASADGTTLRHVSVPFPVSYEAARQQALKSFAVYIPKDTETISLRRACKRLDGTVVWSIVHEEDWSTVLEKSGEEIGVFLPDDNPDGIPYGQPQQNLVSFLFQESGLRLMKTAGSHKECEAIAQAIFEAFELGGKPRLMYDSRMTSSPERQAAHIRERDTPSITQNAKWENLHSPEFEILVKMNPQPMLIYVRKA